jgi:hypothetical protein
LLIPLFAHLSANSVKPTVDQPPPPPAPKMTLRRFALSFVLSALAAVVLAQKDDEVRPAPPSVGADVPLSYFGPAPSTVMKELVGPVQLLTAGTIDQDNGTIKLPLYTGYHDDGSVHFYILTDTSRKALAEGLGLNFAAKLEFLTENNGVDDTPYLNGTDNKLFGRQGKVDFKPARKLVPGDEPMPFPPKVTEPGAIGDKHYSPYIRVKNIGGSVWNAPIVSYGLSANELDKYCDGIADADVAEAYSYIHDKVVQICPSKQTVTIKLIQGFSFGKPVQYISMEGSDKLPSSFEGNTFAPRMADIKVGNDDSAFSAVERLFAVVNGFSNLDLPKEDRPEGLMVHPTRQGFYSAVRGEGSPLNVLGGIPTVATDYSPAWDLNVGTWTPYAVKNGLRVRWLEEFQVLGFAERGLITAPDGGKFGSSGLIVNCPIVNRFL